MWEKSLGVQIPEFTIEDTTWIIYPGGFTCSSAHKRLARQCAPIKLGVYKFEVPVHNLFGCQMY